MFDRPGASETKAPPRSHAKRARGATWHGQKYDHALRVRLLADHPKVRRTRTEGDRGGAPRAAASSERPRIRSTGKDPIMRLLTNKCSLKEHMATAET